MPAMAPSGRTVLIVVGMHRSGTSATTGALACLGVQLGRKLYSGHKDINDKGYFEHSDIADANDELLLASGSSWDDILPREPDCWARPELKPVMEHLRRCVRRDFARSSVWALKDPRVCRLLPVWLPLLEAEGVTPRLLFVVRPVDAVFRSLSKRDGFSRDKAFLLWLIHYLEAERDSRSCRRAFVSFDRFLADPTFELNRLARHLDVRFPRDPDASSEELGSFLSADLRHHRAAPESETGSALTELAYELEERLLALAAREQPPGPADSLQDLQDRLQRLQSDFDPLLVEQLRSLGHRRGELQVTMARIFGSSSWLVGKPIRFVERLLGRRV